MTTPADNTNWLNEASIDNAVFALRPDYRAFLLVADGLIPGASDDASEALLAAAEQRAVERIGDGRPEELAELAGWREAYRAFGAKPQRTRPSVEALVRRATDGLPRIDRITDTYNAISVTYLLPLGGEDADTYGGPARLIRATGDEPFEATASGDTVIEHPDAGEVVWTDDAGVTCRRWNWRQSVRTRISHNTTRALFILDGLTNVIPEGTLEDAASALQDALAHFSPHATFTTRLLAPTA